MDGTGKVDNTSIKPIQVNQAAAAPVPTSLLDLSANLPPSSAVGAVTTANVGVYDAQGQTHQLGFTFTSTAANTWTLGVKDDAGNTIGTASLAFGPDGTLASVTQAGVTTNTAGAAANVGLNTVYPAQGGGTQQINLSLGAIGQTTGLTQFAGTNYSVRGINQNGVPPGAFSSITTTAVGDIVANYDNGQSRTIAQVPITTFSSPELAAAPGRIVVHRHHRLGQPAGAGRRQQRLGPDRHQLGRGLECRHLERVQQADRGPARLLGERQNRHHGGRAVAADHRHEALNADRPGR